MPLAQIAVEGEQIKESGQRLGVAAYLVDDFGLQRVQSKEQCTGQDGYRGQRLAHGQ